MKSSEHKNPQFRARLALLIGEDAPFAWALRVGLNKSAFSVLWHEGGNPQRKTLERICAATGCSMEWLAHGIGEPFAEKGHSITEVTKSDSLLIQRLRKLIGDERPYTWGARVGIVKTALHKVLSGETELSMTQAKKICEATGCSMDWLVRGIEPSSTEAEQASLAKASGAAHATEQPSDATENRSKFNRTLLIDVVAGVRIALEQEGLKLSPDKEASLVALLYEHYADKQHVTSEDLQLFLKLVA